MIFGRKGEIFGTTQAGGIAGQGSAIVFQLTPPATPSGAWTERVLHIFSGGWDSGNPAEELVEGKNGELYGTTSWGSGVGEIFELMPPAAPGADWMFRILCKLTGRHGEGNGSMGGLLLGAHGELYGTTMGDGGRGAVFRLDPPPALACAWKMDVLHEIDGRGGDAGNAIGGVFFGPSGGLYGNSVEGGAWGYGTVFELDPPRRVGDPWTQIILYSFSNRADGRNPHTLPKLIWDGRRAVYGISAMGGPLGAGTIFRLRF